MADKSKGLIDLDGRPLRSMQSKKAFQSARKYLNTGYSNGAASLNSESMKGWDWHGGSPDEDIIVNLPIIRERCRDLVMNAPLVAGMINTVVNSVVGSGLVPEPSPDVDFLGWDAETASRWKGSIRRYWDMFAESKDCDALRMNNFYELTQLACRSSTESGDVFVTLPMIGRKGVLLDLCLNVIEADCICNPEDANASSWMVDGADILGGVELGEHGNVVAYWVRKHHPLAQRITVSQVRQSYDPHGEWVRVSAYGDETGRRNILHLMHAQRPGQRRGVPLLAPVVETYKILDRYIKSELLAALVQSMFTVIMTSEEPESMAGDMMNFGEEERDRYGLTDDEIALGPGLIQYANPGETPVFANPTRPTTAFSDFVQANLKMIGASMGIPYEMLIMTFDASYSASRAAMNMATTQFKMLRSWLIVDYCQPVWAAFMDECVARGYIDAPGYWDSILARRAYRSASWNGPGYPQIDQYKEAQAVKLQSELGITTLSEATSMLTGGDWQRNVRTRADEIERMRAGGLMEEKNEKI